MWVLNKYGRSKDAFLALEVRIVRFSLSNVHIVFFTGAQHHPPTIHGGITPRRSVDVGISLRRSFHDLCAFRSVVDLLTSISPQSSHDLLPSIPLQSSHDLSTNFSRSSHNLPASSSPSHFPRVSSTPPTWGAWRRRVGSAKVSLTPGDCGKTVRSLWKDREKIAGGSTGGDREKIGGRST